MPVPRVLVLRVQLAQPVALAMMQLLPMPMLPMPLLPMPLLLLLMQLQRPMMPGLRQLWGGDAAVAVKAAAAVVAVAAVAAAPAESTKEPRLPDPAGPRQGPAWRCCWT